MNIAKNLWTALRPGDRDLVNDRASGYLLWELVALSSQTTTPNMLTPLGDCRGKKEKKVGQVRGCGPPSPLQPRVKKL